MGSRAEHEQNNSRLQLDRQLDWRSQAARPADGAGRGGVVSGGRAPDGPQAEPTGRSGRRHDGPHVGPSIERSLPAGWQRVSSRGDCRRIPTDDPPPLWRLAAPVAPGRGRGRLSSPALETLAVVAYRQPVVRAEIESIRGVQCGEMLRQLMDRDLMRIVGKSQELGRPFLYGTTKRFLQVFGLGTWTTCRGRINCERDRLRSQIPEQTSATANQSIRRLPERRFKLNEPRFERGARSDSFHSHGV